MSRKRSRCPAEYRQQMVDLVRSGRSPDHLAREFEPSAQSIRNWARQADRDDGRHDRELALLRLGDFSGCRAVRVAPGEVEGCGGGVEYDRDVQPAQPDGREHLYGTGGQSEPLRGARTRPPSAAAGRKTRAPTGGAVPCASVQPDGSEHC